MLSMLSAEDRLKYKETGVEKLVQKIGYSLEEDPASVDIGGCGEGDGRVDHR